MTYGGTEARRGLGRNSRSQWHTREEVAKHRPGNMYLVVDCFMSRFLSEEY